MTFPPGCQKRVLEIEKFIDEISDRLQVVPGADATADPAPYLATTRMELSVRGLKFRDAINLAFNISIEELLGPYSITRKPVQIEGVISEIKVSFPILSLSPFFFVLV